MAMDTNSVESSSMELLETILDGTSGEVFSVGFDEASAEALIEALGRVDDPPTVRLLAQESVLKWVRDDFVVASAAAELTATGTLSLRSTDEPFENVLAVTDDSVVSFVSTDDLIAGLVANDAEFVADARERWSEAWAAAEEFSLRSPARSHVEESLATEFGPAVEADFRTMLGALGTARGEDTALDEVVVSLLVAAKHDQLLYDISKWGEDTGVASKATFSRTKTHLEERGLIDTEKVPIDVGRPRLRLVLGDERLREVEADELASVAQSLLSTAS